MTWFDKGEPPEYDLAASHIKVSPWPHPDGPRIDARFRMNKGQFLPAPKPSRYFLRMRPFSGLPPITFNSLVDILPISDTELEGSTGVDPDGYSLDFKWKLFVDPDPLFSVVGHQLTITYHHVGFPDFWITGMFGSDQPADYDTVEVPLLASEPFIHPITWKDTNYDPLVNTDVTIGAPMANMFEWWPLSECLAFAEPAGVGFAEFNEVNTYKWPVIAPNYTDGWRFEYDIRLRSHASTNEIMGTHTNTLESHYWSGRFCSWRGSNIDTGSLLPLDTWLHVDFDYEWQTAGSTLLRCFRDGVPVGTKFVSTGIAYGYQLGQRGPTLSGFFELRNFKLFYGNEAAPDIGYDFPMQVDACDVSPNLLGGTTTGMALPSCPP